MSILLRLGAIIKKEATVELRHKYAFFGILTFTVILVYLIFKTLHTVERLTWVVLLWLSVLFGGINAIVKSFTQEDNKTQLHYYTIFSPYEILIAKLIYNLVFMIVIFTLVYFGFSFFFKNPIKDFGLFASGVSLGLLGLSTLFTFISSISGQTQNNALMMSILGLPLTIPILLLLMKVTSVSMRLIQDSAVSKDLLLLFGIDLLYMGVALVLFKELWTD